MTLGVSHNQVFYAPHAEAKRLIDAGDIGRPVLIRLRLGMGPGLGRLAGFPGQERRRPAVRRRRAPALPRAVSSARSAMSTRSWTRRGNVGETFAVAVLEFASGARGIIEANHHGPRGTFDDEIEIVGSDAILRLGGIESLSFGYRSGAALSMFRDGQWTEVAVASTTGRPRCRPASRPTSTP